ncbi:MAG: zinc-ribbon domain-containing protein, partial [Clostridia bacterium]|nr:zinc-ribbon domain-containing protein [Clostridia bacterium]
LYPSQATSGSARKVWWNCPRNHSYMASVPHRLEGKSCPYCANRKVLSGFNDLQTLYPDIASEWDALKNQPLMPTDVVGGSHRVVWWICPQHHEYEMSVLSRTQGQNCPVCAGKRVIKGVNDLFTTHPQFADEWLWEKNEQLSLSPYSLSYGSTKKVWWRCSKCEYEWQASPNGRSKSGCPYCVKKKVVTGKNDLKTLFPEIAKKWHPSLNSLSVDAVAPFSNKKAWWICDKDPRHIFETAIYHVTLGEIICPVCANQQIITGVNDLQTTHPALMKEWDWERNNVLKLYPDKISFGVTKKAYWVCEKGHKWQATVASRAGAQRCGCPECAKDRSSSFPEKALSFYLSRCFEIEENKKFKWLGHSELDIYIDSLKLGVEYDGKVWHTDPKKDIAKDKLCQENGVHLIRVREKQCPNYYSSSHKIWRKNATNQGLADAITELLTYIGKRYALCQVPFVDIEKDYEQILAKILSSKKKKSVAASDLIKEWNYEKNKDISPETVSLGTHQKMWWRCANGHEWKAAVGSRSGNDKVGCPYCSGKKILQGYNDLATLHPYLVAEWSNKNHPFSPSQIAGQSNKKFWWRCSVCGLEYKASPAHRVCGRGCPACGRKRTREAHLKKIKCVETQEIFIGLSAAAAQMGVSSNAIGNCCRGKSHTAGGYHWEYLDD